MISMIIGAMMLAFSYDAFKNPDSDWVRWSLRLREDYDQKDHEVARTKKGAVIGGFLASWLILTGLLTLLW